GVPEEIDPPCASDRGRWVDDARFYESLSEISFYEYGSLFFVFGRPGRRQRQSCDVVQDEQRKRSQAGSHQRLSNRSSFYMVFQQSDGELYHAGSSVRENDRRSSISRRDVDAPGLVAGAKSLGNFHVYRHSRRGRISGGRPSPIHRFNPGYTSGWADRWSCLPV